MFALYISQQIEVNDKLRKKYTVVDKKEVKPLTRKNGDIGEGGGLMNILILLQEKLDKLPLFNKVNIIDILQSITPAKIMKKIAVKNAIRTVKYLGEYNKACISYWRKNGIETLEFLDESNPDCLRKLPIMKSDYFSNYSYKDRFTGDEEDAVLLQSSGTTGKPKLFYMDKKEIALTLPVMKIFLRSIWHIEEYEKIEVIVATAKAEKGKPRWGAGYNMVELLKLVSKENHKVVYFHTGINFQKTVKKIRSIIHGSKKKTLIAIYTYAPDTVKIVEMLTDSGKKKLKKDNINFRFNLTGEAIPPYKLFQLAEWLNIISKDLINSKYDDILKSRSKRNQIREITRTFSVGYGAAEMKTGMSGDETTVLWTIMMYLLQRNEKSKIQKFLDKYFNGYDFPWSAFKANPKVLFILGKYDKKGKARLDKPKNGIYYGPAFATSRSGELVNCLLDTLFIWDLDELAELFKEETNLDIKRLAKEVGIKYSKGDMLLTNGRIDSVGNRGLDAAVSWGGLKIYGHNLQRAVSEIKGFTGRFTAQNIDYRNGERVSWIHFESTKESTIGKINKSIKKQLINSLESENKEFWQKRKIVLEEGGEDLFDRQLKFRVLKYRHKRFEKKKDILKYRYILKPKNIDQNYDIDYDPVLNI